MRDVFVTGLGTVSPFGTGVPLFWENLRDGRSALRETTLFDAAPFRNRLVGEVPDVRQGKVYSRGLEFLRRAAAEAVASAKLTPPDLAGAGIIIGTNFGCSALVERHVSGVLKKEPVQPKYFHDYSYLDPVNTIADSLNMEGLRSLLSLSCASSLSSLYYAFDVIRTGRADIILAGGFDELSLYCYSGLNALRAITPDIIRPFDKNRKGTLFAEGAGVLVVESEESVRRRGAAPQARMIGAYSNNDAYHLTAPEKQGRGIVALMEHTLEDAGITPGDVGHINAHATGTKYNDVIETNAIKTVFGAAAKRIPLTANKSMIGHTMGAAGALEAISAIMTLVEGVIPPTKNLETPDPACDLDYCPNEARACNVETVMSNSYGFGGTNASVIFKKA